MATVKLTDHLARTIVNNARNQFSNVCTRCNQNVNNELAKLELYLIPPEHRASFSALPPEYFPTSSYLTLRFGTLTATHKYDTAVPFSYNQYNAVIDIDALDVPKDIYDSCVACIKAERAAAKEADEFSELVEANLRNFITLNSAVKAWPALEKLVPKDCLERMQRKAERSAVPTIDEEAKQSLNTAMLKSQIL